jgi:hypothetical protein
MAITRINHIPELCKKKKLAKKDFLHEAGYITRLSRPTLEKAFNGDTDLDYDTVERLAWFFDVPLNEVLESRF